MVGRQHILGLVLACQHPYRTATLVLLESSLTLYNPGEGAKICRIKGQVACVTPGEELSVVHCKKASA